MTHGSADDDSPTRSLHEIHDIWVDRVNRRAALDSEAAAWAKELCAIRTELPASIRIVSQQNLAQRMLHRSNERLECLMAAQARYEEETLSRDSKAFIEEIKHRDPIGRTASVLH